MSWPAYYMSEWLDDRGIPLAGLSDDPRAQNWANEKLYWLNVALDDGDFGLPWIVEHASHGDPLPRAWEYATADDVMFHVLRLAHLLWHPETNLMIESWCGADSCPWSHRLPSMGSPSDTRCTGCVQMLRNGVPTLTVGMIIEGTRER